jgi:hypothetical protein
MLILYEEYFEEIEERFSEKCPSERKRRCSLLFVILTDLPA